MWFLIVSQIAVLLLLFCALVKLNIIMNELEELRKQVEANAAVEASAKTLIEGLAGKIEAAGTDPAKLAALTSELKGSADQLAAAVAANTPQPA